MYRRRHEECVWACRALIQFAGKHYRLSYIFSERLLIKNHSVCGWTRRGISAPRCVFQGCVLWAWPGYRSSSRAPELLSTRCGRRAERGLMWPDMEIMFAFSFLECYRLSWNSAWQFLTTRQPSAPAPLLFSRCGTDASLLVLWLCSRPPIAGDRCQDQHGPCLNIAVTVLP